MMKSPTNVLNCIKIMKSKLRSDKEQLQMIRKDFGLTSRTILETKSVQIKNSHPQQPSQKQNLQQIKIDVKGEPLNKDSSQYRRSSSIDGRNKLLQIHRSYQQKLRQQQRQYQEALQRQRAQHREAIQQLQVHYEQKIQEQASYIQILTQKTETEEAQKEQQNKYEQIINNLLQQNAILVEKMNMLKIKMQNDKSSKHGRVSQRHKSRLKINKGSERVDFAMCYNSTIVRVNDKWDKQNRDNTNRMMQQSEDDRIQNDEVRLRSIKGFVCVDAEQRVDILPACLQYGQNTTQGTGLVGRTYRQENNQHSDVSQTYPLSRCN